MTPDGAEKLLKACAQIIVGQDREAPHWLAHRLNRSCARISMWRDAEESAPKRRDMKIRLTDFADAVSVLQNGISDHRLTTFLGQDWRPAGTSFEQIVASLSKLATRAETASQRLSKQGQGGRGEAYPTEAGDALSSQQLCAWTIRHAILLARYPNDENKKVGPDLEYAQQAANLLWTASGGMSLGRNGGVPTGWREHFISVGKAEAADDRRSAWLRDELSMFTSVPLVEFRKN